MIKFYKHATTRNGTKGPNYIYVIYFLDTTEKHWAFYWKTNHIEKKGLYQNKHSNIEKKIKEYLYKITLKRALAESY